MSFFAAYDALCEEGTATSVCNALADIADISVLGKVYSSSEIGTFLFSHLQLCYNNIFYF